MLAGQLGRRPFIALGLMSIAGGLRAQGDWPSRTIKLVVPAPPGGTSDGIARVVAERMAAVLKSTIISENKGGAAGQIAHELVKRAPADGYTIMLSNAGAFTLHPFLRNVPYTLNDFTVLGGISEYTPVLGVRKDSGIKTVADLVRLAKQSPGKMSFASAGTATLSHINSEQLARATGTTFLHVPYKGSADALNGLMGGQVDFMIDGAVSPSIATGRLLGLAAFGRRRTPDLPDVPTIAEAGLTVQLPSGPASMLLGPKGLPKTIADELSKALHVVLQDAGVQAAFLKLSAPAKWQPPLKAVEAIQQDQELYRQLTQELGLSKQS